MAMFPRQGNSVRRGIETYVCGLIILLSMFYALRFLVTMYIFNV